MAQGSIDDIVKRGLAHHQAGRADEAVKLYREALSIQPNYSRGAKWLAVHGWRDQRGRWSSIITSMTPDPLIALMDVVFNDLALYGLAQKTQTGIGWIVLRIGHVRQESQR